MTWQEDGSPSDEQVTRRPPTNLGAHRRRTERNLIVGGFVVLFVVGGALVGYFYGIGALLAGWACLGSGVALYGLLIGFLKLIEAWSTRGDDKG